MKNKSHKTKGARARMGGNVECLGNCREDGLGSENDNKCQDGHYVYRVGTMKGFCGDCKQHFPEALEYFIRQSSSQSLPRPSSNQARACVLHNQLSGQGADNTVQHHPKQAESRPQSQGDAGRHGGHQQDGRQVPEQHHVQVQEEEVTSKTAKK